MARIFLPQWAPMTSERAIFWQFDPTLGWRHLPAVHAPFVNRDFSVTVTINSEGLRGREYPQQRNNKKRMLVLGDSFGWGFGVNDDESFPAILEQKHPDWEILNASVSGYGTVQQYLYLQELIPRFKPDVVLLLFYDNDFQDNVGRTEYWYRRPVVVQNGDVFSIKGAPLAPPTWKEKLEIYVLGHFYLGTILDGFAQGVAGKVGQLFSSQGSQEQLADDLSATAYILGQLLSWSQSQGVTPIVVMSPLSDTKLAAVEGQCQLAHVACFHLKQAFNLHRKEAWHFEHNRHWNVRGHQIAAEAIDQWLEQSSFWSRPVEVAR